MMSAERSFEAWEEVQRHGQDLADKLAQGFTGLIQSHITPPSFPWPSTHKLRLFDVEFDPQNLVVSDFGLAVDNSSLNRVSAIFDIGNRIGQAGVDVLACVNGVVNQFLRSLPVPFRHDETVGMSLRADVGSQRNDIGITLQEDLGSLAERFRGYGFTGNEVDSDGVTEEEASSVNVKASRIFDRSKGTINITTTYESRTRSVESSLVARGDLWRVEASQSGTVSGNEHSSMFLVQLGPVLFLRDSTLLLPIHLSKQHLLWYGYDRKNGMHSLCPAIWSKHRRWLLMSMICLNPLACSFMDVQFPNGQVTYVSGEGISTSAFLPVCGGLLQAQGQYPGDTRISFSCKNKWGTCFAPAIQLPEKSLTLGLSQALAWKRSGLMVRPTVQFSILPTFGGSNPGLRAELTHSVKEELNVICGCELLSRPSAFASVSLGRSKWNGNVGRSGIVAKVETPLENVGQPSFTLQFNSGIEF